MKTKVSETSIQSYNELEKTGKQQTQQERILDVVFEYGNQNLTSRDIAQIAGIERSSVCGRLNELCELGVLTSDEFIRCSITGKWVSVYRLNDNGGCE